MAASGRDQRPLAGRSAWIFTTGAAGMDAQTRGVADALGLDYQMKPIHPKGVFKLLAPWGPVAPSERFGKAGSHFAPPWPEVAIALGRVSVPYMRALRRRSPEHILDRDARQPRGARCRRRHLGAAARSPARAERHHHAHRAAQLHRRAARTPAPGAVRGDIAALPRPRIAVILGGKNKVYEFRAADDARFAASLRVARRAGRQLHDHAVAAHARAAARGDGGSHTRLPAHPVEWRRRQSLSASFSPTPTPSSSRPTAST